MTVDAVAHLVGYSSRSHFSRAFRAHYGVTPGKYRSTGLDAEADVVGARL